MGDVYVNPAAPDALTQDLGELRRRVQAAQLAVFDARLEYLAQPTKSARKRVKALEKKLDAETSRLDELDPPRLPGAIAPQQSRRKKPVAARGAPVAIPIEPEAVPEPEAAPAEPLDRMHEPEVVAEPVAAEPAAEPLAAEPEPRPPHSIGAIERIRRWLRGLGRRSS